MLEPIKSTKSTGATQATEATDAVRPISEQRPGTTLRDRLYQQPVTTGAKKPSALGNETSLYQKYSVAKTLPTVPVQAAANTANFQGQMNKFGTYADFWKNLISSSKTPSEEMEYHTRDGVGKWMTASEGELRRKYSSVSNLDKFVESQLAANKRIKNKFYQERTKDYEEYFKQDPIYEVLNIGSKGTMNALSKDELASLSDIANREGLGQRGYEALVDQAYTAKSMLFAKEGVNSLTSALDNPDAADWAGVAEKLGIDPSLTMGGIVDAASDKSDKAEILEKGGIVGAGAGLATNIIGKLTSLGTVGASTFVPLAAAMQVASVMSDWGERTMEKARFNPIKNGKLATSINDFSGSERRNLEDWADRLGKGDDEMVKIMNTVFVKRLSDMAQYKASDYDTLFNKASSDNRISYGDSTISQTQQYVDADWSWKTNQNSPEYWGSWKSIYRRKK